MVKQSLYDRPEELSDWVFWGKEGTFPALLGGSVKYVKKVRKANRPVISITVSARGKYRYSLEIDLLEGFKLNNIVPTSEGLEIIKCWITDSTYRHPHDISTCSCPAPYYYGRFSDREYVVKAANALSNIPLEYYVSNEGR